MTDEIIPQKRQAGHLRPPGRAKGIPNKATKTAKEAIARFVDGNAERLAGWLDEMAVKDPEKAFNAFMSVVEYHIPKLSRVDSTQKITGNLTFGWDDQPKQIAAPDAPSDDKI